MHPYPGYSLAFVVIRGCVTAAFNKVFKSPWVNLNFVVIFDEGRGWVELEVGVYAVL